MASLGIPRATAIVPTLDRERRTPFQPGRGFSEQHIEIFGHSVDIDIPTGNVLVTATDIAYAYYGLSLAVTRIYDLQEQHMQLSYLRGYPNVDPKPHWF